MSSLITDAFIINAAGKMLSQRNSDRIKAATKTLIDLMIDAKVLSAEDLRAIIDEEPSEETKEPAEVQAGSFKTDIQYLTWSDRLRKTLDTFYYRFDYLHNTADTDLTFEEGQSRKQAQQELLNDLADVLSELSQDHPGAPQEKRYYAMSLSSEFEEDKAHLLTFDFPVERVAIAASESKVSNIADYNRRPIRGVLFRVDEPSEAIPSVGPGLPLYVSREVAETTLSCVCGLPLDADDSLSKHANKEIAGVIQSAEIHGDDYYISGYVWPWSQSEKVQAIAQNLDRLGMSMNAAAKGHKAEVNGQEVFWVDELQLLGANILYSDRATYRKTRLVAAESLENGGVVIAAESQENEDDESSSVVVVHENQEEKQEEPMSQEMIAQLSALSTSFEKAMDTTSKTQVLIQEQLASLQAQVNEVRGDLEQRRAAIQASAAEQQKKEEQRSLVEAIQAAVDMSVAKTINPSGSPSRKTHSISASSSTQSSDTNPLVIQLAKVSGQLELLEKSPYGQFDGVSMMGLMDEKRRLEAQIASM